MPDSKPEVASHVPASVEIIPGGPVEGVIRPPGSKSLTNRALICAAFAKGSSTLTGALQSEDTKVMIEALKSLGVGVDISDGGKTIVVHGMSSAQELVAHADSADGMLEMYVANSGTTIRFLVAALSAVGGSFRLSGVERMHQRPIADLISALEMVVDGSVKAISQNGCPPVEIQCAGWKSSSLSVGGSVSSQYLSGLMMAAPLAVPQQTGDHAETTASGSATSATHEDVCRVNIAVSGELVSRPYVDLTARVMRSFGASVELVEETGRQDHTLVVAVDGGGYAATEYEIEPDASAASYFWAAAAISGGSVAVQGLSRDAMQGDVGFCQVLEQMGCEVTYSQDQIHVQGSTLHGVDVDMNAISDTVQTLAVVALFADSPTRVRGVAHNRYKETDRIGDLARELRKLGSQVQEHEDGLTIHPLGKMGQTDVGAGVALETYHDHRMAMSLALAGLKIPKIRILDPACTGKTYPQFFADLEALTGRSHHWHSCEPS